MGILTSLIKLPFTLGKKTIGAVFPKNEDIPITAVTSTRYPQPYQEYYEALGFDTDVYKNKVIVWNKGTSEKKKTKVLEELQKVV